MSSTQCQIMNRNLFRTRKKWHLFQGRESKRAARAGRPPSSDAVSVFLRGRIPCFFEGKRSEPREAGVGRPFRLASAACMAFRGGRRCSLAAPSHGHHHARLPALAACPCRRNAGALAGSRWSRADRPACFDLACQDAVTCQTRRGPGGDTRTQTRALDRSRAQYGVILPLWRELHRVCAVRVALASSGHAWQLSGSLAWCVPHPPVWVGIQRKQFANASKKNSFAWSFILVDHTLTWRTFFSLEKTIPIKSVSGICACMLVSWLKNTLSSQTIADHPDALVLY
jgi:hypothetical protein